MFADSRSDFKVVAYIVTAPYKHVVFTIFHNVKQPCLKPMKPDYDLGT